MFYLSTFVLFKKEEHGKSFPRRRLFKKNRKTKE